MRFRDIEFYQSDRPRLRVTAFHTPTGANAKCAELKRDHRKQDYSAGCGGSKPRGGQFPNFCSNDPPDFDSVRLRDPPRTDLAVLQHRRDQFRGPGCIAFERADNHIGDLSLRGRDVLDRDKIAALFLNRKRGQIGLPGGFAARRFGKGFSLPRIIILGQMFGRGCQLAGGWRALGGHNR